MEWADRFDIVHACTLDEVNERLPRYRQAMVELEEEDGIRFAYTDSTGVLDIQRDGSDYFQIGGYRTNPSVVGDTDRIKEAIRDAWQRWAHDPVSTTVPIYSTHGLTMINTVALVAYWRSETDSLYMNFVINTTEDFQFQSNYN